MDVADSRIQNKSTTWNGCYAIVVRRKDHTTKTLISRQLFYANWHTR